ncbi:MAG: hypothetical protein NC401_19745 [Ruminococcus sp.]|nr:hypothetical protein [Ruminococcus sp.]
MYAVNTNLREIDGRLIYPDSFNYLKSGNDFYAAWAANGDVIVETIISNPLEVKERLEAWLKQHPQSLAKTEKVKTIETSNGQKITLEITDRGVRITTLDNADKVESRRLIFDEEFAVLFKLYESMMNTKDKTAYIFGDFVRDSLVGTRLLDHAIDYAEAYKLPD